MGKKMRKGFTLLELVVVIIIISILVTLGLIQYTKVMEKGRSAEARANLALLRKLQFAYYLENNEKYGTLPSFVTNNGLPYGVTFSCDTTGTALDYYFRCECTLGNGTCYAYRCTSGGKSPQAGAGYYIYLTTAGNWGGTAGYY